MLRVCESVNNRVCESVNNIDALYSEQCTCTFAMKQKAVHIGLQTRPYGTRRDRDV